MSRTLLFRIYLHQKLGYNINNYRGSKLFGIKENIHLKQTGMIRSCTSKKKKSLVKFDKLSLTQIIPFNILAILISNFNPLTLQREITVKLSLKRNCLSLKREITSCYTSTHASSYFRVVGLLRLIRSF